MPTDHDIEIAARAMRNSKAWPVVFEAGSARTLAKAALEALERDKAYRAQQSARGVSSYAGLERHEKKP